MLTALLFVLLCFFVLGLLMFIIARFSEMVKKPEKKEEETPLS